jgi:hypothetical protein
MGRGWGLSSKWCMDFGWGWGAVPVVRLAGTTGFHAHAAPFAPRWAELTRSVHTGVKSGKTYEVDDKLC